MQKNLSRVLILLSILIGIIILSSVFLGDVFLTKLNFQILGAKIPEFGLLAIAIMFTILSGGIDLSIISINNLAGVLAGIAMAAIAPQNEIVSIILAIFIAISVAIVCGLFNGFLIAYIKIPAILATLGTMSFFIGIATAITEGKSVLGFPQKFAFIGNGMVFEIPLPLIIFIICILISAIILNKTKFGMSIYMVGSNPVASLFAGLNNKKVILKTYMISGLLAGISSIIMMSRFNSAKVGYGVSYLLVAILVVVLGGVDPNGGVGSLSGVIMAVIILQLIESGFNILSVSVFVKNIVWGGTLLFVMVLSYLNTRYQQKVRFKKFKKIM